MQGVVGGGPIGKEVVEFLVGIVGRRVVECGAVDDSAFAVHLADIPKEQECLTDHGVACGTDEIAVAVVDVLDTFNGKQLGAESVHLGQLGLSDGFLAELSETWSAGQHLPHAFLHA